ncbi:MAG: hypothetical protein A3K10_17580 [Bacteroidetes bacterium RIFCSPLOWO2_12_FULL_31_6]|nr:MAG: hypothetical protein A3K10_17580 [Bacteroidetes bacterium RIFCSPLOWO2_12_FULL_31_6]
MLITSVRAYTQYTYSLNTIYMIPPTSGCNGEWAVLDSTYSSGSCTFPTYSVNPFSCAIINHRNGDTLFLDLCSIPCDVTIMSDSGNICLTCSVDFSTNVVKEKIFPKIKIYPNPTTGETTLIIAGDESNEWLTSILDVQGRTVFEKSFNSNKINLKLTLDKGVYLVRVTNKNTNEMVIKKLAVSD